MPFIQNRTGGRGGFGFFKNSGIEFTYNLGGASALAQPTDDRNEIGFATDGNKLFFFGGKNSAASALYNTVQIYDIASNQWSTGPTMAASRTSSACIYYPPTNKIYVFGGGNTSDGGGGSSTVYIYNVATNSWDVNGALAPAINSDDQCFLVGSDVYVGRGTAVGATNTTWYKYSITNNTWSSTVAAYPIGNCSGAAATVLGKGYVFGGQGSTAGQAVYMYENSNNTWVGKASMPGLVMEPVATTLPDNSVYVIGGMDGSSVAQNYIQIYNPVSNTWDNTHTLTTARTRHAALSVKGRVYVAYGSNTTSMEAFDTMAYIGTANTEGTVTCTTNGYQVTNVTSGVTADSVSFTIGDVLVVKTAPIKVGTQQLEIKVRIVGTVTP
jgi:N-acetylneuraminic acid mutarotase